MSAFRYRLSHPRVLLRWARLAAQQLFLRVSGHKCPECVSGTLVSGDVRAKITQVHFRDSDETGKPAMVVTAGAPTHLTGAVGGRMRIETPTGSVAWLSPVTRKPSYFGIKTSAATWKINAACDLEPPEIGWRSEAQAAAEGMRQGVL